MPKLDYEKSDLFLHCKHCINPFLGSKEHETKTPAEFNTLEASTYPYTYPDGHTENIVVIWCHNCHKQVWDTRHLTHR